jgi:hypothetical protein
MSRPGFYSGKDTKVVFFIDGAKVTVDVTSWSAKPNVTDANDGVCGEDRDRLQTITNFYEVSLTCKQTGVDDLKKLLVDTDNDDAAALPLDKQIGILVRPHNGTSVGFVTSGDTAIGGWDWASPGRSERQTLTIPIRAQYFKPVQTL